MQIVINSVGTYVHVKDQMFEVKVPVQQDNKVEYKKYHFSAQKVSHIVFATSGAISTDAISLALKNNIDIIFFDEYSDPIGRIWFPKSGSTSKIRQAQLIASLNYFAVKIIKEWIIEKLENQITFLKSLKKHRSHLAEYLDEKVENLENLVLSITKLEGKIISEIEEQIRGIEGTAGRIYFDVLSNLLAPEYRFEGRSMRPAKDLFNAFLNYAYGVLYSIVEKALIIAGIDPYLGFLHRNDYNLKSMVFDFIEPYRVYAEYVVFRLFSAKKVNKSHCDLLANGVTLNKEGKELLMQHFTGFMENETVKFQGRNCKRTHVIQLKAHNFAKTLLNEFKNTIKKEHIDKDSLEELIKIVEL